MMCLGALAPGAFAADVNIKGSIGETLEGSDNYFLSNSPLGTTFKSLTALNLDVLARTPGWRYLLSNNVSYYNYFGDGADQTRRKRFPDLRNLPRRSHHRPGEVFLCTVTWNRADVASTQLRESGVVTSSGTIDTLRAGGGVTYDINRIDSIAWTGQFTRTSYTTRRRRPTTTTPHRSHGSGCSTRARPGRPP